VKKWLVFLVTAVLLCGCGTQQTFETVADEMVQTSTAYRRTVLVDIPSDAAVFAGGQEREDALYFCSRYTMGIQILDGGSLDASLRTVSGYSGEDISMVQQQSGDVTRYDFVWSSAGEGGLQLGRGALLDDGSYHYVLTCMVPEGDAAQVQEDWDDLFSSFALGY